jgi:hypothetical protein
LVDGVGAIVEMFETDPYLITQFPVNPVSIRAISAPLSIPELPFEPFLHVLLLVTNHLRRTGQPLELFVERVNAHSALLSLIQRRVPMSATISVLLIFANFASRRSRIVCSSLARAGVVSEALDLLSFFNPQIALARTTAPLRSLRFIHEGIDENFTAFHKPLMKFACHYLSHHKAAVTIGVLELISRVMGLCSIEMHEGVLFWALGALYNASETCFDAFITCFFDLQFHAVIFRIIDQFRVRAFRIIERTLFHTQERWQLDRLLDSGLLQLVIDAMGADDPAIREIAYNCALNIASFRGRYSQIWIDQEGLVEHMVDDMNCESFDERTAIVRLLGNLFLRPIISEALLSRIDFVDTFLPILETRQSQLVDIVIGIFNETLNTLDECGREAAKDFCVRLRDEGALQILEEIAEGGHASTYSECLALAARMNQTIDETDGPYSY